MDNLLAGTLILLARRFACWVVVQRRFAFQLVEIIPGSSRSPFRDRPIHDRLPVGMGDRFQPGTVIGINPES
jgi:hypothetical protein